MPILSKLRKKVEEMTEVSELSEWADAIIEGDGGQEAVNPVGIPEEGMNEGSLNELSKATLKSYSNERGATIHADQRDAGGARTMAADKKKHGDTKASADWDDEASWLDKRAEKGAKGVAQATTKIAKKGVAEGSLNELSSDLLKRSAQAATDKRNQAMDPELHNALGGGYMNPLATHYDNVSQKMDNRAAQVRKKETIQKIASKIASPAVMRKIGMAEQGVAEANGRRYSSYNDELSSRERDEQNYMDQSKSDFKRAEMQHELGHEDDPNFERNLRQQQLERDQGPWYIRIDGKIYRQSGQPKSFDLKNGANNYALAMIKNNPSLQGKVTLSKSEADR
jgi:hypothetical protein